MIKCYRVWFKGGTACLVDAINGAQAVALAEAGHKGPKAVRVECLDKQEVKGEADTEDI